MTGTAEPQAQWASTWTPTKYASNGAVQIAYDQAGPRGR